MKILRKLYSILVESIKIIIESVVYLLKEIKSYIFFSISKITRKVLFKRTKPIQKNKIDIKEIITKSENDSNEYVKELESNVDKKLSTAKISGKTSSFTKKITIVFLIIVTFTVYCLWGLPDYRQLGSYKPPLITRVYSEDEALIAEFAAEKRIFVTLDTIPTVVKNAFISAEDKRFYNHYGFDFSGLLRASYNNFLYLAGQSNNIEGASTISQQVVKNFLLNTDKTIKRKLREAILTLQIEYAYNKNYILELYLNQIYLGRSAYGVSMASLNYFDKPVTELTIEEAAFLASIPKAPSKYDPKYNYDGAKARRDWVISRMLDDGKITKKEAIQAINTPIRFIDKSSILRQQADYVVEEIRKDVIKKFDYNSIYNGGLIIKTTVNQSLQQYAYSVLRSGITTFDNKTGYRGPLAKLNKDTNYLTQPSKEEVKVPNWLYLLKNNAETNKYKQEVTPWRVSIVMSVTKDKIQVGFLDGKTGTLDLSNNTWAQKADSSVKITELTDFNNILQSGDIILLEETNDKALVLRQIPEINGALVAMNPQTGEILAMQGGFSFLLSEFNRATQAYRQPGSIFKPFVYLAAIASGLRTVDLVLDAPIVIESVDKQDAWKPKNDQNAYRGFVTLRNALEHSRNLATIRVASNIGLSPISRTARKLGIYDEDLKDMSTVIGSKEVTLLNIVRAYAILANGGKEVSPSLIRRVQDKNGRTLFKNDIRDCVDCDDIEWHNQRPPVLEDIRKQLVNPVDAYIVNNMLQGVIERGTGRRASHLGYNIAGKTGTTNDTKDVWCVGFTPDLVVGIYFGADNPKSLGNRESSTSIAVPIFTNFMGKALAQREPLPFRTPKGIDVNWINYKTGEPGVPGEYNVIMEVSKTGEPKTQRIISENGRLQEVKPSAEKNSVSDEGIY